MRIQRAIELLRKGSLLQLTYREEKKGGEYFLIPGGEITPEQADFLLRNFSHPFQLKSGSDSLFQGCEPQSWRASDAAP